MTHSAFTPSINLLHAATRSEHLSGQSPEELTVAIDRYVRFLHLCALHPDRALAPTRDIDEIWHLHMQHPRAYVQDCYALFGDILDHDGGFGSGDEAPTLARLFLETTILWEQHYGESYAGATVKCTRNCVSRCTRKCSSVSL